MYQYRRTIMNIPGITIIKGSKAGPKVGIIACTHGNEPTGLSILRQLKTIKPAHGTLILIHNNIKATRLKKRFCDLNMNRLPSNALSQKSPKQYEVKRLQQLYPILKNLDYVLDIHTTSAMPEPFVVILTKTIPTIAKKLGIPNIISNMAKIQKDKAFISFCGSSKAIRIGVECGIHGTKESRKTAQKAALNFLTEIGIIKKEKLSTTWPRPALYQLIGSIMAPQHGYKLTRLLKPFEKLKKGEHILTKKGSKPVTIPFSCQVLLPPKTTTIQYPNEELFFTIKQL